MSLRIAVDIGGTFTDLIAFDERSGRIQHAKSLTTTRDPVEGILDCVHKAALDMKSIDNLIHGSTIAINTLIERKGATVGLIVTRGTRDVYLIGRGNRPEAYNLFFTGLVLSCRAIESSKSRSGCMPRAKFASRSTWNV